MELDLNDIAVFVVVAEERHFGRASTRLNMTRSGISKRMRRLELALGVTLLERDTAGVHELTINGRRFLDRAESILDLTRSSMTLMRSTSPSPLRIGVSSDPGTFPSTRQLGTMTTHLAQRCPSVSVDVRHMHDVDLREALAAGAIDVAWSTQNPEGERIHAWRLGKFARVAVISSATGTADAPDGLAVGNCGHELRRNDAFYPLLEPWRIGGTDSADERCLGTADGQFPRPLYALDATRLLQRGRSDPGVTMAFRSAVRLSDTGNVLNDVRLRLSGGAPQPYYVAARRNDARPWVGAAVAAVLAASLACPTLGGEAPVLYLDKSASVVAVLSGRRRDRLPALRSTGGRGDRNEAPPTTSPVRSQSASVGR